MANKNKGQYLLDGTLQEWWDVDAYHKGRDSFDLTVDETDGLAYLTINGQKVGQGVDIGGGGGKTRYNISKLLTKASLANTSDVIVEGATYISLVVPANGYEVETVSVTMDGTAVANAYNEQTQTITVANVRGDLAITVVAQLKRVDMLDITWANHAITCGQNTNNYNAWSPHNLQYDDVNDCFVFLQCHCNRHLNHTASKWTLSLIDPYDPSYCENVPLPEENVLGALFVENGTWTITMSDGTYRYRSTDAGNTWVKEMGSAASGSHIFGIYKAGGKYFAGNDTDTEHTYYVSDDLLNWETKSFGELGHDILCESTFCEFQGRIWAFNRTNDSELAHPVILISDDNGETWTVFSDQLLHGWRSTVSCLPFDSYIAIADIDRDNGIVYYSTFDGTTVTERNNWAIVQGGDDFHNVNLATNYKDAVVIEFMHPSPGSPYSKWYTQRNCENVMLVGGTRQLPTVEFFNDEVYNFADLVAYANQHFSEGTNGVALTNWRLYGSVICDQKEDKTFFTELELPLDLVVWYTSGAQTFHSGFFYNGGKQLRTWNNDPENGFVWVSGIGYNYSSDPIVQIGGKKFFVCNIPRTQNTNMLMVLTLAEYFVENVPHTGSAFNTVVDQPWQSSLGFRRVIPENNRNDTTWSLAGGGILKNKPSDTPLFKHVRYVPAPAAD